VQLQVDGQIIRRRQDNIFLVGLQINRS